MLHRLSLTQYYETEEDSDSDTDSDISRALWEASSVSSYQLRKKDKGNQECSGEKRCFWHTVIGRVFEDVQKLQEVWKIWQSQKIRKTVENKRYNLRSDNDETLDSIEPVTGKSKKGNRNPIKQQTENYK